MVVKKKIHQKSSKIKYKYKKVLNGKDPFDQLIMKLDQNGVLDVCVVGIGENPSTPTGRKVARKPIPRRE